ncbi:MAG: PilZ domain-containing protein [Minisyncoccota bacterium]
MEERRKAERWYPDGKDAANFLCDNLPEKVRMGDVSPRGMMAFFPAPVFAGTPVKGKIEFCFELTGSVIPFSVEGEVVRVDETDGLWKAGVKFTRMLRGIYSA